MDVPAAFPATTRPFSVWVQLTDGNGVVRMKLVFEHVLPERPAFEVLLTVPFPVRFDNPNVVHEHEAVFEQGIDLPCEGLYRVRLEAGGTTVMQRYFVARTAT